MYFDKACSKKEKAEEIWPRPKGKKTECFFPDEKGKEMRNRAYGSARGGSV